MADVVGRADVEVRATLSKYDRDMAEAERRTRRSADAMQRSMDRGIGGGLRTVETNARRVNLQFGVMERLLLSIGGVMAARAIVGLADEYTNLSARIRLVLRDGEDFASVQDRIFSSAQRARVSVSDLTTLYVRLRQAMPDLGDAEALNISETLARTLTISGASASETSAFLTQISQALASGVLRGDEFRSVMENNARFARLLADHLNVSVGELRAMAEEGALTSQVIRDALAGGAASIASEFERMPLTVASALTQLQNAFARFVGETDTGLGATRRLAQGLALLAENLSTVIDAIIILGVVSASSLVSGAAMRAAATISVARAIASMGTAAAGASGQLVILRSVMAATVTGARGLVAVLGGPLGIAISAVSIGFLMMGNNASRAASQTSSLASALDIVASLQPADVAGAYAKALGGAADNAERLTDLTNSAADAARVLTERTNSLTNAQNDQAKAIAAVAEVRRREALATLEQALAEQLRERRSIFRDFRNEVSLRGQPTPELRSRLDDANEYIAILQGGIDAMRAGAAPFAPPAPPPPPPPTTGGGAPSLEGPSAFEEFFARLGPATDPIEAVRALGRLQAEGALTREEFERLAAEVLRLPRAFAFLENVTDPAARLELIRERFAQIASEATNVAETDAFRNFLEQADVDAALARLNAVAQAVSDFSDPARIASLRVSQLQRDLAIFQDLGRTREYYLAIADAFAAMAFNAGEADRFVAMLNEQLASVADGAVTPEMRSAAENRIREAAREGRFSREEQANTLWRSRDFRDSISDGLYDAMRSGDWKEALAKSMNSVMSGVMRRAADRLANWVADAIFGAMPSGGGGGGFLGSIVDAIGSIFTGGGGAVSNSPIPGRAGGGGINPFKLYRGAELGTEPIFLTNRPGQVMTNAEMRKALGAGGGGRTQIFNIDARGADGTTEAKIRLAAQQGAAMGEQKALASQARMNRARTSI